MNITFIFKSDDDSKLCLQKCDNKNCNLGSFYNNICVLEVTKSKSLHILGKQKHSSVNSLITINQSKRNIEYEALKLLD